MLSWWWLLIGFPAGIGVAWLLGRRTMVSEIIEEQAGQKKSGPVKVTRNQPRRHEQHYYGCTIQIDNNPCDAVKAIADHRYLADKAPHFPLPDCDRAECRCMLRPQDDRRAGYDRRGDSFSAYGNFELDRHTQKRLEERDRRNSS